MCLLEPHMSPPPRSLPFSSTEEGHGAGGGGVCSRARLERTVGKGPEQARRTTARSGANGELTCALGGR